MTALLAAAASGFAPARPEAQGAACVYVLGKVPRAAQPRWLCIGLLAEITARGNGQRSTDMCWCPHPGNAASGEMYCLTCPRWSNPVTLSSFLLFSISPPKALQTKYLDNGTLNLCVHGSSEVSVCRSPGQHQGGL